MHLEAGCESQQLYSVLFFFIFVLVGYCGFVFFFVLAG